MDIFEKKKFLLIFKPKLIKTFEKVDRRRFSCCPLRMFHDSERDRTFRRIFGCCGIIPLVDNISANAVTVFPRKRRKNEEVESKR